MPSTTSAVGGLTLPVPAGAVGDRFEDPVVEALLDFCAFWLNNSLNAKLANLAPTSATAVPTANRYTFDPSHPRGHSVRLHLPALYVWWDGKSTREQYTTIHDRRMREINLLYVAEELPATLEMDRRYGLMNAVDAILHKLGERWRHPSYSFDGNPAGQTLTQSLAPLSVLELEWLGGQVGRFGVDEGPAEAAKRRVAPRSGRDFPAFSGRFRVTERVQQDTLEDPADVLGDLPFGIRTLDEGETPVHIMDRVLEAPDGSEDL